MLSTDIQATASMAGHALDETLANVTRQTAEVVATGDIPTVVAYFSELRETIENLAAKATALTNHVQGLSRETIPTMFENANTKTIIVNNVGRVTINVRWSATQIDAEAAQGWCRQTGNDWLITPTINAGKLTSFAKAETIAGRPLPSDIFKVGTTKYVSITKESEYADA